MDDLDDLMPSAATLLSRLESRADLLLVPRLLNALLCEDIDDPHLLEASLQEACLVLAQAGLATYLDLACREQDDESIAVFMEMLAMLKEHGRIEPTYAAGLVGQLMGHLGEDGGERVADVSERASLRRLTGMRPAND